MSKPMVFIDTGGWFALSSPADRNHAAAMRWFSSNRLELFTTNFVVDETLTLLRRKGLYQRAIQVGESFFVGDQITIYRLTEDDEKAAWETFRTFADKEWSFTDCTSKVVIEKMGIATAFAFDQHFRQSGTVQVVP